MTEKVNLNKRDAVLTNEFICIPFMKRLLGFPHLDRDGILYYDENPA